MENLIQFVTASKKDARQRASALVDFIYLCEGAQTYDIDQFLEENIQQLSANIQREMRQPPGIPLAQEAHAEGLNTWFNERRSLLLVRTHLGDIRDELEQLLQDPQAREQTLKMLEEQLQTKAGFFSSMIDTIFRMCGARYGWERH